MDRPQVPSQTPMQPKNIGPLGTSSANWGALPRATSPPAKQTTSAKHSPPASPPIIQQSTTKTQTTVPQTQQLLNQTQTTNNETNYNHTNACRAQKIYWMKRMAVPYPKQEDIDKLDPQIFQQCKHNAEAWSIHITNLMQSLSMVIPVLAPIYDEIVETEFFNSSLPHFILSLNIAFKRQIPQYGIPFPLNHLLQKDNI